MIACFKPFIAVSALRVAFLKDHKKRFKQLNNYKLNMKTTMRRFSKTLLGISMMSLALVTSCNNDDDAVNFSANDTNQVQEEAVMENYHEDVDDMSTLAVSAEGSTASGSRESSAGRAGVKPNDGRFTCATVTFEFAEDNSTSVPHGFITIDFGTGCTDPRGNVRKGIIKIEFKGKRFMPGSKIITTLVGYSINGVSLEGTRTVTNTSASLESNPKFTVLLEGGKATWPDLSTATREVNRTREWVRAANPINDQWIITGTAAGTNRNGKTYQMQITKPLVYKRECATSKVFIAVEGTKVMNIDGREITIDFGTGTCDKLVTITINGQSKEIEVKGEI
jgi:hypothetical protein